MLRTLSFAVTAAWALLGTGTAFAESEVPYRAYEVGRVTALVPSPEGAHVEAALSGFGTVSGPYTGTLSYDVVVDPVTNIRSFKARAVITTTSGDQLFGEAAGRNDEPTPPFIYSGIFRITGGTGRFQHVKAAGRFVGYDPAQGGFTTFYDGEVGDF